MHSEGQLQSLVDTIEDLRKEKFPDLDATLVREILRLHASGQPLDTDTARALEQAVEHQLSKKA